MAAAHRHNCCQKLSASDNLGYPGLANGKVSFAVSGPVFECIVSVATVVELTVAAALATAGALTAAAAPAIGVGREDDGLDEDESQGRGLSPAVQENAGLSA